MILRVSMFAMQFSYLLLSVILSDSNCIIIVGKDW